MDHIRDAAENKPINVPLQKTKLLHLCEVCGKEEWLTPEEGYHAGWDYPPCVGQFGVISPRTCPHCTIEKTVWWDITANHKKIEELTDAQKVVVERILAEPFSLLPPLPPSK